MLADPAIQGTSVAALNAAAAAIVVWATDRGQTAADVRHVLLQTARRLDARATTRPPRILDVDAALAATRRERLLDTLLIEPVELAQILAETGLRPEVAVPLLDELVASGRVSRRSSTGSRSSRTAKGPAQEYTRLRAEQPSGWDRTREFGRVVRRAGELARSGRITAEKVQQPVEQRPRGPAHGGARRHRRAPRARQPRHRGGRASPSRARPSSSTTPCAPAWRSRRCSTQPGLERLVAAAETARPRRAASTGPTGWRWSRSCRRCRA